MTWATELVKVRRMLRDPSGLIWSEAFLRHMWNDVQQDFQLKTGVLEDLQAERFPPVYQFSYQQDWEFRHCPSTESKFYQCLLQHDDLVFCHRWEPQQRAGTGGEVADYGIHFTQPWEACMSEVPGELIRMRFPRNFNTMKFIAYDEEPIDASARKGVHADPGFHTKEGEPLCYYRVNDEDYVLYPTPSTAFVSELSGESMALYADGDTEDTTTGSIATRTGSSDVSDESGMSIDVVDTSDSVFMVYSASPTDMASGADEPDYPEFLRKYIRHGVVGRAYSANTDGRIRSLGDYWELRYSLGVQFTKRYMRNRRQDRDYRFTSRGTRSQRRYRHPRLPDGYPHVDA